MWGDRVTEDDAGVFVLRGHEESARHAEEALPIKAVAAGGDGVQRDLGLATLLGIDEAVPGRIEADRGGSSR